MLITQERYSSNVQRTTHIVVAAVSTVLATILAGWIWNGGMVTIFEIVIWRPLAFLTILMGASFWWSKRNAASLSKSLQDLLTSVPWALALALIVSLIPVWKLDFASLPMGLGDIGLYFVSLGLAPRLAGPDILLRGFAWGVAIFVAIKTFRSKNDVGACLLDLLLTWVFSSMALLLPWFIFWIIGAVNGAGLAGGQEVIRVFSQTALNSYWSNLQIVRWFLGFGEQLSHTMSLLLSSMFFILSSSYLILAFKDRLWPIAKKTSWENCALMILAVVTGLIAGWGRAPWAWIDIAVWLVLAIVLVCSAVLIQAWADDAHAVFGYCLAVGLVGSFILGWPVLVAFLFLICAALICNTQASIYKSVFNRVLIFTAFAGLSMAFVRRGDAMNRQMLFTAAALLVLCLPAFLPSQVGWLKRAAVWFAAGVVATLLIQSLIPVAVAILAVAIWHALQKIKPNLTAFIWPSIYACAFLSLILGVWLPRLLNPRLYSS